MSLKKTSQISQISQSAQKMGAWWNRFAQKEAIFRA